MCNLIESGCLGLQPKVGGEFLLNLNICKIPIDEKYREGLMKRTLKRELKVLEIVGREAVGSCGYPPVLGLAPVRLSTRGVGQCGLGSAELGPGLTPAGGRFPTGPSRNTDQGV